MRFDELYLNDNILDALDDMHFETCTPIQEACIPEILDGRDLIGVAQTGTGKTAAYLLPILSLIDDGYYPEEAINCVVMSPTRELAQQIDQAMEGFGYYLKGISSVPVYGGNDGGRYDQETRGLQLGANVVIATPGRLISHITMKHADLSQVSFFVLDEADRMLDMGFSDDILKIASYLPDTCQTIMFSATMPQKIEQLAKTLLKNPVEVKLAVSRPADNIMQAAYVCHENQKLGIIRHLFKNNELSRVIIFAGSKLKVKEINRSLRQMNINCGEMHSDLDQSQRDEMMYRFKSGQVDVLVATDIVARGIDIDDIATVMNYDVPHDSEDYVHRIGRTARAQRDGKAITLVRGREISDFMQIEKFLGYAVEKLPLPEGLGEAPEYKPMGRGGTSRGKGRGHNRRRDHGGRGKGKGTSERAKATAPTKDSTKRPASDPSSVSEAKRKKHRRRKSNTPNT
ncbi:MAG: DEAD/DEAH box helicase [Prevotella sp.]|nr:DEAD/DEAH box helicase [Prevotella sp.]